MFLVLLGVGLVQGVEQCGIDEGARPDHARWPDEEFPKQTGKGIPHELGGEANHYLVAKSEVLPVEDVLGQQEVCCVGAKLDDLGHHGDDGVLLDVERSRVQGPDVTEGFEFGCWENPFEESTDREGKQLDHDTRHENGGVYGKNKRSCYHANKWCLQRKLNNWLNAGRAAEKKSPITHLETKVSGSRS